MDEMNKTEGEMEQNTVEQAPVMTEEEMKKKAEEEAAAASEAPAPEAPQM